MAPIQEQTIPEEPESRSEVFPSTKEAPKKQQSLFTPRNEEKMDAHISIVLRPSERERWMTLAKHERVSVSTFIREIVNLYISETY